MNRPIAPELRDWIETVVDDKADDLLRYLQRRVNQPHDAADLLGRVFLRLWENGAKVPPSDTDARMWCFGIARNVLREHYRHTAKSLVLADELREHLRHSVLHATAADSVAEAQIRARAVRAAVVALDEKSRKLMMLSTGTDLASRRQHASSP